MNSRTRRSNRKKSKSKKERNDRTAWLQFCGSFAADSMTSGRLLLGKRERQASETTRQWHCEKGDKWESWLTCECWDKGLGHLRVFVGEADKPRPIEEFSRLQALEPLYLTIIESCWRWQTALETKDYSDGIASPHLVSVFLGP